MKNAELIMQNEKSKSKSKSTTMVAVGLTLILLSGCAKMPSKQFYVLHYVPQPIYQRTMPNPYACVIRLKEFTIEEAYNRTQIVYRLSPYELRHYNFKIWAVKPTRMVTDLAFKHLNAVNLVSGVVRRFDEGRRPDYELSGAIEALEEYDSGDIIFAHVAMRVNLTRLSDGANIYSRHFDIRKRVYRREAEYVIREMSQIMEYIMTQVISDIDTKLAGEFGMANTEPEAPMFMPIEEPDFSVMLPNEEEPSGDEVETPSEGDGK